MPEKRLKKARLFNKRAYAYSINERSTEFAGDLSLHLMTTYRSLHYLFNQFLGIPELAQHYQLLFILMRLGGMATQTELVKYLKAGESTTHASIKVMEAKVYLAKEKHNKHNKIYIIRLRKKLSKR